MDPLMTTRRIAASALLVFGLAGLLASPGVAFGQRSEAGADALKFLDATAVKGGLTGAVKPDDYSSESAVLSIIGNIVNVILGFVGIIFFVQLFYAGFRWMSSGGNEEVVTESRQTIKSAIIGIVVVFAAFVITNFTLNQVANITNQDSPSAIPTVPTGICRYGTPPNCADPAQWTEITDVAESFCGFKAVDSGCTVENSAWVQN